MNFQKIPNPINFTYPTDSIIQTEVTHFGEDVYSVVFHEPRWEGEVSPAELARSGWKKEKNGSVVPKGSGFVVNWRQEPVVSTLKGMGFGILGKKWVVNFQPKDEYRFYGLGEKAMPLERSGARTWFYNTDVWADFPGSIHRDGFPDPLYISVPYVLIDAGSAWVGILLTTPYPAFASINAKDAISDSFYGTNTLTPWLSMGAEGGIPELYLVLGDHPKSVTAKLQRLQGKVPLPPLWALGYHQSRWGYESFTDLDELDRKFQEYEIPCDGLWLDIDYMDGFRVFTWDEKKFSHPKNQVEDLRKRSRRVVPIIDPGVKKEETFDLYKEMNKQNLLCLNPEGKPFVGFVWPGETVFPDFSLKETCSIWAERVQKFLSSGVEGIWLDMNDPSTGSVDPADMLFTHGQKPHNSFRNAYCLAMQKATWEGFTRTYPTRRPFMISRSAFVSSSRFGGVWTGDNWSNRHNLQMAIPLCLGLSLSGLPFCGVDVPGFGGDADAELAIDWYKVCFLFPLFRNHSVKDSKPKEPWQFEEKALGVIREYIRFRYRLLPYLYNLFVEQDEKGFPILLPLFLAFPQERDEGSRFLDTEFLVGSSILQAPCLEGMAREVYLPGRGTLWFDWFQARWEEGGRILPKSKQNLFATPIFVREGAILPLQASESPLQEKDLTAVEFHLFFKKDSAVVGEYRYQYDDGETFSYRKGIRTSFSMQVSVSKDFVRVYLTDRAFHFKPCRISFVVYDRFERVILTDGTREEHLFTQRFEFSLPGKKLSLRRTRETVLKN